MRTSERAFLTSTDSPSQRVSELFIAYMRRDLINADGVIRHRYILLTFRRWNSAYLKAASSTSSATAEMSHCQSEGSGSRPARILKLLLSIGVSVSRSHVNKLSIVTTISKFFMKT